MRRVALVAVACLVFAPAAHAGCGATSTAVAGRAPLTVTFTATCEAASYNWSFGDGGLGEGRTVQHTYAAGAWRPALTTEAGVEAAPPVTAVSLRLAAPRIARYAQWVTLRADVIPRVPVTLRGRRFVAGKLRVRVLGTARAISCAASRCTAIPTSLRTRPHTDVRASRCGSRKLSTPRSRTEAR